MKQCSIWLAYHKMLMKIRLRILWTFEYHPLTSFPLLLSSFSLLVLDSSLSNNTNVPRIIKTTRSRIRKRYGRDQLYLLFLLLHALSHSLFIFIKKLRLHFLAHFTHGLKKIISFHFSINQFFFFGFECQIKFSQSRNARYR